VGPALEREKIPGLDSAVQGGDTFECFGRHRVQVLDVGGHTKGHIAYWFPESKAVFVGDALFALGCGRLFEGTAEQGWASLARLMALPDDTAVYCAHEYTESNAKFAVTVEALEGGRANAALAARVVEIRQARALGRPTVPTTIGLERATNPFVRPAAVRIALGLPEATSDAEVFGEVRRLKDIF